MEQGAWVQLLLRGDVLEIVTAHDLLLLTARTALRLDGPER